MSTFYCDICHASRPTSELAPFDLLNLTACRQCVRERQKAADQPRCVFITDWPNGPDCYQCGKPREDHQPEPATP